MRRNDEKSYLNRITLPAFLSLCDLRRLASRGSLGLSAGMLMLGYLMPYGVIRNNLRFRVKGSYSQRKDLL